MLSLLIFLTSRYSNGEPVSPAPAIPISTTLTAVANLPRPPSWIVVLPNRYRVVYSGLATLCDLHCGGNVLRRGTCAATTPSQAEGANVGRYSELHGVYVQFCRHV